MAAEQIKKIAQNKKAYHDYFILETYEAGIELFGTEVKSIREGRINLKDSWCSIDGGEIFANSVHISPYDHGNIFNRDPLRVKRLLMHKKEIHRLYGTIKQQGLTLIPLSVYLKTAGQKWKSVFARAKRITISATLPPKGSNAHYRQRAERANEIIYKGMKGFRRGL